MIRLDHRLNLLVADGWTAEVSEQFAAWIGLMKSTLRARASVLHAEEGTGLIGVFDDVQSLEAFARGWVLLHDHAFARCKDDLLMDRADMTHCFSILFSFGRHVTVGGHDEFTSDYLGVPETVVESGPDLSIAKTPSGKLVAAYSSADAVYAYYEDIVLFRRDLKQLGTVEMMLKYPRYCPVDQSEWVASGREQRTFASID